MVISKKMDFKRLLQGIPKYFLFYCLSLNSFADTHQVTTTGSSVPSNPAAVNVLTGTGTLQALVQQKLGIQNNHGIRIGGNFVGDINNLFSGGIPHHKQWTFNGLFLLGLSIETQQFIGLPGGLFDVEFLQFNGEDTNAFAGTVQGYNSLPGSPPLNRSELYKLWYRQAFFNNKLFIRIGKSVPSLDFDNVIKPIPLSQDQPNIPAVSGLIFTPLFVNASMLGVMPGYYNSAYGLTINFAPTKRWYFSYGLYDGNLAQGKQIGLTGPNFNGNYFEIAETGFNWLLGKEQKPGDLGVGLWRQIGLVQTSPILKEHGAWGYYLFGTQRLWYKNPFLSNKGISSFYQYGQTTSSTLNMTHYLGAGLTAFGLVANRDNDTMGIGAALSWLNQKSFNQTKELILQVYYQVYVMNGIYIEPVISYLPKPGAEPHLSATWAGTVRLILLF